MHHENNILICETCEGTGRTTRRVSGNHIRETWEPAVCQSCNGSGLVMQEIRYKPFKPYGAGEN